MKIHPQKKKKKRKRERKAYCSYSVCLFLQVFCLLLITRTLDSSKTNHLLQAFHLLPITHTLHSSNTNHCHIALYLISIYLLMPCIIPINYGSITNIPSICRFDFLKFNSVFSKNYISILRF